MKQMGDPEPGKAILVFIITVIKTYLGLLCQQEVNSQHYFFFPFFHFDFTIQVSGGPKGLFSSFCLTCVI